jgi:hypothetical protein
MKAATGELNSMPNKEKKLLQLPVGTIRCGGQETKICQPSRHLFDKI